MSARTTELKEATLLAKEGYLTTMKHLQIENRLRTDISEISSDDMAKLFSIVTDKAVIDESVMSSSQMSAILASVQSKLLKFYYTRLNEENTRALVTAMSTRVQRVMLVTDVTLDQELLAEYDGQGRCTRIDVYGNSRDKYGTKLKTWAADKKWRVRREDKNAVIVVRQ